VILSFDSVPNSRCQSCKYQRNFLMHTQIIHSADAREHPAGEIEHTEMRAAPRCPRTAHVRSPTARPILRPALRRRRSTPVTERGHCSPGHKHSQRITLSSLRRLPRQKPACGRHSLLPACSILRSDPLPPRTFPPPHPSAGRHL
jgi:hypothetical protein